MAPNSLARPREGRGLRDWQRRALVKYLTAKPRDFLAVATPGAGKTSFALRIAAELLADRIVDKITVVVPTEHLKSQWAQAASEIGIALDPQFSNSVGVNSPDYHGVVVTYAQVASRPGVHRVRTERDRTLVVFDEIHHGGDAKSWGAAIQEAFDEATRRVALTGTPFRSDDTPIPFVRYAPDRAGVMRSQADHSYGYGDALRDGVVRPVVFLAYSGEARWRDHAGQDHCARLGDTETAEYATRAWRTALDPAGQWMPAVLTAADTRLQQVREQSPDAGAMVIASDQESARAYAELLTRISGQAPTVVLSDDKGASSSIARYAAGDSAWLVAVRMVSEGVDIPRLAVGVYATSASTPLFFAQAVGRFVRSRRPGETASIFLPSVPTLLELASQIEAERDHALGRPHRDTGEAEPVKRTRDADVDDPPMFESLGADAELDQLIFDGASFTTSVAGAEDVDEFFGIPGLLDAGQIRALQDKRAATARQPAVAAVPAAAGPSTTHGQLSALRRELGALVSAAHHRTGRPHGWIHSELRRRCGGPPVAAASRDQLRARIDTVKTLSRELA
ncbi:hypothetical protein A5658_04740 [Mycobacterium sp. 1245111.1]|uniref:DEAD/DEAH box helicase n=1 Tax=Mycobacterium sp. 1245111.1 TaxID=1834073 RepID=UPI0007FDDFEF|nr:DEAD/DEAH box helicase [Mycobacterium sp. 1245111.1]OBK36971.1 hypothetical protein A5658_04740 [Mycobacterium sp. 1245111.1]